MKSFFFVLASVLCLNASAQIDYVNPMVGTGGHGHTFPGPVAPFGMVQLSPDTRNDNSWDACGGYYYHDSFILGFSHTHLSGTGVSDLGDVLFQPANAPEFDPKKYKQSFDHINERAEVGYYKVLLNETKTLVELTASEFGGFQKYSYPQGKEEWVILDLEHRDALLSFSLEMQDGNLKLRGHRQSKAWADNQWVFFETEFSRPWQKYVMNEAKTKVAIYFGESNRRPLFIKTVLSFTDHDGVQQNSNQVNSWMIQRKDFDEFAPKNWQVNSQELFDLCKKRTGNLWLNEMSHLQVDHEEFKKEKQHDSVLNVFYTAWYHCLIHPSLASDADFRYRGRDQKIHQATHNVYHVFSLWDTYRALHPLLTLTHRTRTREFVQSMLLQYQDGGRLPVWELGSSETNCMIGFHSVPVILEAIQKGILVDFDTAQLIRAIRHSSDEKEKDYQYQIPIARELLILYFANLGYIDVLKEAESVSKTLEYAYDDWCVYKIIGLLQPDSLLAQNIYLNRSKRFLGLFDPETKTMRPRRNGQFLTPYKPGEVNNHYTEANAWQYSFYVPHKIDQLISLMGGKEAFHAQLDSLFYGSEGLSGREQADISGLIGQYAHGNEPSHHMAYLYNNAGSPQKTQKLIKRIMKDFYSNTPSGLIGNEDCGQMSAWYVMSALGIYAMAPGSNEYSLGYPLFPRITLRNEMGEVLTFERPSETKSDIPLGVSGMDILTNYTRKFGETVSIEVDPGRVYYQIPYDWILMNDGLKFSYTVNKSRDLPEVQSGWERADIVAPQQVEKDSLYRVNVRTFTNKSVGSELHVFVRYIDSPFVFKPELPGRVVHKYVKSTTGSVNLDLKGSVLVWACLGDPNGKFTEFTATYITEKPNNFEVKSIAGKYNPQYSGGGPNALVDGVLGTEQWRSGGWQGYQSQDFEAVIDLKQVIPVKYLGARFLTDERAWIFLPKDIRLEYSIDGNEFFMFNEFTFNSTQRWPEAGVVPIILGPRVMQKKGRKKHFLKEVQARYIRVSASNFGKLPYGHPGYDYNGDAFIFIDEVVINPEVMEVLLEK
jgi:predicted alpha-1,2-mannosidase